MAKELILKRRILRTDCTIGELYAGSEFICEILEDPDRGLYYMAPTEVIRLNKISGNTAIPTGEYVITLAIESPRFRDKSWAKSTGGKVPRLKDVPGYEGILIHPGNSAADTEGCLLPGSYLGGCTIRNSVEAYNRLLPFLEEGTLLRIMYHEDVI